MLSTTSRTVPCFNNVLKCSFTSFNVGLSIKFKQQKSYFCVYHQQRVYRQVVNSRETSAPEAVLRVSDVINPDPATQRSGHRSCSEDGSFYVGWLVEDRQGGVARALEILRSNEKVTGNPSSFIPSTRKQVYSTLGMARRQA
jgi:hypothetical protein